LIKGFPTTTTRTRTTTTTKQNVDPAVYYVYSRVKIANTTLTFLVFSNCEFTLVIMPKAEM
jgi:hypothetical protein